MSKYGNANKEQYSKKQLAAIREFKEKLQAEASDQGVGDEAKEILNKVYASLTPDRDPVQEAAERYLKEVISHEGEEFATDWSEDDVHKGLIAAFKAGHTEGSSTVVLGNLAVSAQRGYSGR